MGLLNLFNLSAVKNIVCMRTKKKIYKKGENSISILILYLIHSISVIDVYGGTKCEFFFN